MAELHDRATADLDVMKQAFTAVDERQRRLRAYVQAYVAALPERVARTGLVPQAATLDREVEDAITAYLDTLDSYPLDVRQPSEQLRRARYAFHQVSATLSSLVGSLDQFIDQYIPEFDRVGQVRREDETLREESAAAVRVAETAAQRLVATGLHSEAVERALEQLRGAAREVGTWTSQQGRPQLVERVQVVKAAAEQVATACEVLPGRVERARRRLGSVRTRLDAVDTRRAAVDRVLGELRREYSVANWDDVETSWKGYDALRAEAEARVTALAEHVHAEDWDRALPALEVLQKTLSDLDVVVDGPADRLRDLRAFQQDPESEVSRARFAVRDAQMLVRTQTRPQLGGLARELDRLATTVDTWRGRLEAPHPDYWAVVRDLREVTAGAQDVVRRFRESLA